MKVDNLIDALNAFRRKHGNVEVTLADPTRPVTEDGMISWTDNFQPGYTAEATRADGSLAEGVILLVPYPDFLSEAGRKLFEV